MRKLLSFNQLLIITLFIFSGSYFVTAQQQTETDLKILLDKMEVEYEDISVMMGTANWNVYANEGSEDQDTPKQRYFELFNNVELNSAIDYWMLHQNDISEASLKRRVEVWKGILTAAAVDFNKEIFQMENKLEALLANPGESDTEYTTEEMNAMVLDLMKKRNTKARELGYENYAVMHFELNGLGWEWFSGMIEKIDGETIEPYKQFLAQVKKEKSIEEIGFQDVIPYVGAVNQMRYFAKVDNSQNESNMRTTLAGIGINYDELPIRFVVENIPYGGNGLAIQIPNDFRVVMKDNMPLEVWMHELGHGLHGMFTKTEHPILKGYEWCVGAGCAAFSEGMAETSAEFVRNVKWIKKYADNTDEEIAQRDSTIKANAAASLRQNMINFMFEVEFYKDLSQDPSELREELYKKYLLLDEPLNRPLNLSANIIYVAYPNYLQNYFFANMISWQVHKTLEKKFGEDFAFNKEVVNFLVDEFYADGELKTWRDKLKHATSRELDVDGYLESLGI